MQLRTGDLRARIFRALPAAAVRGLLGWPDAHQSCLKILPSLVSILLSEVSLGRRVPAAVYRALF